MSWNFQPKTRRKFHVQCAKGHLWCDQVPLTDTNDKGTTKRCRICRNAYYRKRHAERRAAA